MQGGLAGPVGQVSKGNKPCLSGPKNSEASVGSLVIFLPGSCSPSLSAWLLNGGKLARMKAFSH